jgi:hypothetical protein
VIPSFGPRLGLTNDAKRDFWIKKRAQTKEFSRWECEELMILFNTISTLEEAREERDKAEAKLDKEREFLLQQQRAGTLHFNLFLQNPSLKNSYFFLYSIISFLAQSQQQAQAPPPPQIGKSNSIDSLFIVISHMSLLFLLSSLGDDLGSWMANLEITSQDQQNASAFCTSAADGFGFLPTYIRFDPTDGMLCTLLVPTPDEIEVAPRLEIFGEKMGLQSIKETVPNGIEDQFVKFFEKHWKLGLKNNGRVQLKSKNLEDGIASSSSYEDCHHTFGNEAYLSVIEHKGSEASAFPAISQAAVTATNFAIGLLKRGVPRQSCIIPVIGHSGIAMVIGATIILEATFPTFIPLSKHLDLSDPYESKVAFAYIKKASDHCLALSQLLLGISAPDVRQVPQVHMALDLSNNRSLFIKTIDRETYQRGIGLFSDHNQDPTDVEPGIQNMMMVFNKLYNSATARPYVAFPLSIRTPDSASKKLYQIIYQNLSTLGFVIGAPNRMTDEDNYNKYCISLRRAVDAVHAAGVLHVDLYLSNVMWKKTGDEVEIKIIDWDASQLLSQEDFHPNIKSKLEDHLHFQVTFGPEHDKLYLSILDLEKDVYSEYWDQLSSGNKGTIDNAFFSLLNFILERMGK